MVYHFNKTIITDTGYYLKEIISSHDTLEEAIRYACLGQPTQTGTKEWVYLPSDGKTTYMISSD